MALFRPITLPGGVRLLDSDWPMDRDRKQAALDVFYAEFRRLLEETAGKEDWESGCHSMWGGKDSVAFLEQRGQPGGYHHFSEYRAHLKGERALVGLHGLHRTFLAWKDDAPVGGVVLYNLQLLGHSPSGVLEFEAHLGPFLTPPSLNREFFEFLLKNEVSAEDDSGVPFLTQLVMWRHDSVEPANHWRSDTQSALLWDDIDGLDGEFEDLDGVMVRRSTRLRQNSG